MDRQKMGFSTWPGTKRTRRAVIALFGLFMILIMGFPSEAQKLSSPNYELVARDAAWCWFSDPRAVYHKGLNERIYYGYINSKGDVVISSRDVKTKNIQSFVLHKELQVDDHNVPSILFLPDGKLLVFYTEHNGRFFMRKSKSREDITSWETERVIPFGGKGITYSHPVMLKEENNRLYMFWRGSDWRPTYSISEDLGETWSTAKALVASKGLKNRPYLKVVSDNKSRIDFAFTDGHPSIEPTNSVYHMYYKRGVFYQTNGDSIASVDQLPLEHSSVRKIYDGKVNNIRAWVSDIALDKKNNPVVVYSRYPQDNDHRYHYARWDGKSWLDEEIVKAGGWMPVDIPGVTQRELHYSGGISLDHKLPSNVYLSRPVNGIFEVEHWQQKGKLWKSSALTSQSALSNVRPYVVAGSPGKNPIVLWMSGIYTHWTKFDTDLYMNIRN